MKHQYRFETLEDRIASVRFLLENPQDAQHVLELYAGVGASEKERKRCIGELMFCAGYCGDDAVRAVGRMYRKKRKLQSAPLFVSCSGDWIDVGVATTGDGSFYSVDCSSLDPAAKEEIGQAFEIGGTVRILTGGQAFPAEVDVNRDEAGNYQLTFLACSSFE